MKQHKLNYFCINIIILLFGSSALLASPIQEITAGYKYYIACKNIQIRTAPSPWAKISGTLKFGTKIIPKEVHGSFELEDSDENSKVNLETQRDDESMDIEPELYTRYIWVEVDEGIIPSSCVTGNKDLLNIDEVNERVKSISKSKAKRNFSDNETADQTAMKGAAGSAKFGKPNFKFADKLINQSLTQQLDSIERNLSFRKSGLLGEFK